MLIDSINGFSGEYAFLSNFEPSEIFYDGIRYPSVEHAYQALKTLDVGKRLEISKLYTPGQAKRAGRGVDLREDWEDIKQEVMYQLLLLKFSDPELEEKLLATGNKYLEETNWWGDTYWGVCKGKGSNYLGLLLMRVREEIKLTDEEV